MFASLWRAPVAGVRLSSRSSCSALSAAANRSPALVAAQWADLARFIDEVSKALAQRIGTDPMDPEAQLAAFVVAGLLRVGLGSTFDHARQAASVAELNKVVRRDIRKAAQLAEPTLTAFDNR